MSDAKEGKSLKMEKAKLDFLAMMWEAMRERTREGWRGIFWAFTCLRRLSRGLKWRVRQRELRIEW